MVVESRPRACRPLLRGGHSAANAHRLSHHDCRLESGGSAKAMAAMGDDNLRVNAGRHPSLVRADNRSTLGTCERIDVATGIDAHGTALGSTELGKSGGDYRCLAVCASSVAAGRTTTETAFNLIREMKRRNK